MVAMWLLHRAIVVALVLAGLDALADVSSIATVAVFLFLIFATVPVAEYVRRR